MACLTSLLSRLSIILYLTFVEDEEAEVCPPDLLLVDIFDLVTAASVSLIPSMYGIGTRTVIVYTNSKMEVNLCAGRVSKNTRYHQLRWDKSERRQGSRETAEKPDRQFRTRTCFSLSLATPLRDLVLQGCGREETIQGGVTGTLHL